jgi:hypothetical protein
MKPLSPVTQWAGKLIGLAIAVGVGYLTYRFLWIKHTWLAMSACFLIWFLLASLYKPK